MLQKCYFHHYVKVLDGFFSVVVRCFPIQWKSVKYSSRASTPSLTLLPFAECTYQFYTKDSPSWVLFPTHPHSGVWENLTPFKYSYEFSLKTVDIKSTKASFKQTGFYFLYTRWGSGHSLGQAPAPKPDIGIHQKRLLSPGPFRVTGAQ